MSLGQFSLLYLGLDLGMPAGLASLVLQVQVIVTMVLARLALGERSTRRQLVGALVGTAGLVIVAIAHGVRAPVVPLLVTLAAGASWAIGNVVSRRARVTSGLSLVVWSALVVPLPALGLSLWLDGPSTVGHTLAHLPAAAIVSTAYTVVGASLLGYVVWNSLLARYPAGAVVPYVLLVPPVGILAAWLAKGETPSALEVTGGVVMLAGVAAATVTRRLTRTTRRPSGRARRGGRRRRRCARRGPGAGRSRSPAALRASHSGRHERGRGVEQHRVAHRPRSAGQHGAHDRALCAASPPRRASRRDGAARRRPGRTDDRSRSRRARATPRRRRRRQLVQAVVAAEHQGGVARAGRARRP